VREHDAACGEIASLPYELHDLVPEGREGREGAQDADHEERARLRLQLAAQLDPPDDSTDKEASEGVDGESSHSESLAGAARCDRVPEDGSQEAADADEEDLFHLQIIAITSLKFEE
jgi:hypothetical protein